MLKSFAGRAENSSSTATTKLVTITLISQMRLPENPLIKTHINGSGNKKGNNNSSNNNNGAEMDVLLDEIEVGIEPATISPKVSNFSSRGDGSAKKHGFQ